VEGSFIALAGEGRFEEIWTAEEIEHHGMPVKLVVLSACQTGLGGELDGGISGLARAFQLAGSPRVVMSLWSVYDDSTAELMSDFVSRLRNHAPAEALRLSMLELRKTRPDPAHWAAFSIFGTPL
jgi:CHAT domain-containing protein